MEDNAAPQPGTPVLEPVVVERLVRSAARVTPYVSLTGQAVTHPSVYERDIAAVRRARTMAGVVDGLNRCRARWAEMGVAKEVRYTLEPFADGEPGDVHVRLHVEEARPKKEVGVFTTDTAVPELRASLRNILGRAYDVSLHYVPSSSKMQSGALTLTSFVPWVGQRCEYYVGRRTENELSGVHPIPVADSENVTEAKVAVDLVGGEGSPSPWVVKFALGMQRRLLLASDAEAWPQDFGASTKCYLRWAVRHTAAGHHTHPRLAALYGLPVSGHVASAVTEVAGGPMPGEASHVRSELQATKFVSLLPGLTLDLSAMAGVAFPLTFGRAVSADAAPSVLLPDRLFLTWRHIRGYRSLGPSNVTDAAEQGLPPPRRFRPTGGNASWALGAALNFPLPLAPAGERLRGRAPLRQRRQPRPVLHAEGGGGVVAGLLHTAGGVHRRGPRRHGLPDVLAAQRRPLRAHLGPPGHRRRRRRLLRPARREPVAHLPLGPPLDQCRPVGPSRCGEPCSIRS